jgi:hypothetical protein
VDRKTCSHRVASESEHHETTEEKSCVCLLSLLQLSYAFFPLPHIYPSFPFALFSNFLRGSLSILINPDLCKTTAERPSTILQRWVHHVPFPSARLPDYAMLPCFPDIPRGRYVFWQKHAPKLSVRTAALSSSTNATHPSSEFHPHSPRIRELPENPSFTPDLSTYPSCASCQTTTQ